MLLHMTQPGLSRQISALEHDLGALQDVAARMVALAYNKHRTMPGLEQFARLVMSMLGADPIQSC